MFGRRTQEVYIKSLRVNRSIWARDLHHAHKAFAQDMIAEFERIKWPLGSKNGRLAVSFQAQRLGSFWFHSLSLNLSEFAPLTLNDKNSNDRHYHSHHLSGIRRSIRLQSGKSSWMSLSVSLKFLLWLLRIVFMRLLITDKPTKFHLY